MKYTLNRETIIPSHSISQKPFIIFIPNINNIKATINQVRLASHIAENDCVNQSSTASLSFFLFLNSSFMRSNISMLASIAIPRDSTSHAIDASVRTTENCLSIKSTMTTYIKSDTAEITQQNL